MATARVVAMVTASGTSTSMLAMSQVACADQASWRAAENLGSSSLATGLLRVEAVVAYEKAQKGPEETG